MNHDARSDRVAPVRPPRADACSPGTTRAAKSPKAERQRQSPTLALNETHIWRLIPSSALALHSIDAPSFLYLIAIRIPSTSTRKPTDAPPSLRGAPLLFTRPALFNISVQSNCHETHSRIVPNDPIGKDQHFLIADLFSIPYDHFQK